jgi:2-keto-4-pentenoate hydratase/2-oxohepta-3-ene-1,7-dioic acid hydratase in catechol pathway
MEVEVGWMKLLSFKFNDDASFGAVVAGGVLDLKKASGGKYADLKAVIAADALAEMEKLADGAKPDYALDEIDFLPVIPNPEKIFCIGINYGTHMMETSKVVPEAPMVFARYANSQIGHRQPFLAPPESTRVDWEGEIAVIIGKRGRRIKAADAWSYIAGYAPYNDGSMREHQKKDGQWTPGKNFVGSGPFGPWMATRGEIEDNAKLNLVTRLNGVEVQRATSHDMIYSIPQLIEYVSMWSQLEPGDVFVTGTPGGVGSKRTPPLFMKDGDVIEVEIEEIGVLSNPVVAERV